MTFLWDYGDGSTPDDLGVHMYQDTGRYVIRLTAENYCGSETFSRTIDIFEESAVADFTVNPENGSRDTLCSGEVVTLDGSLSEFADFFLWQN